VPDASRDLCFYYRPEGRVGSVEWEINKQLALSYCLSEPLEGTFSRLVFSRLVTQILAVAISIKALAMTVAYICVRDRPLLAYEDLHPLVSNHQSISYNGGVTKIEVWCYSAVFVVFSIWLNVLYVVGLGAFGQGALPSSMMD